MNRIEQAKADIASALAESTHPAVMVSFGKDSVVLLDLLWEFDVRHALFMPDVDEPIDFEYIRALGKRFMLDVTTLPAGRAMLGFAGRQPQILSLVSLGPVLFPAPFKVSRYDGGEEFFCVDEMLRAEKGETAWMISPDLVFWGNKSRDLPSGEGADCLQTYDLLGDRKEAFVRRTVPEGTHWKLGPLKCCSPLHDWTSEEVWAYIRDRNLPVSRLMYRDGTRTEYRAPVCVRCHDPNESGVVTCPKLRKPIVNLGHFTGDGLEKFRNLGFFDSEDVKELRQNGA